MNLNNIRTRFFLIFFCLDLYSIGTGNIGFPLGKNMPLRIIRLFLLPVYNQLSSAIMEETFKDNKTHVLFMNCNKTKKDFISNCYT